MEATKWACPGCRICLQGCTLSKPGCKKRGHGAGCDLDSQPAGACLSQVSGQEHDKIFVEQPAGAVLTQLCATAAPCLQRLNLSVCISHS